MQVSRPQTSSKELVNAIAPTGNLFLLLMLPELRRQGLTFLAFYVLQRIIERSELSEYLLRKEAGLEDYEVSRACKLLVRSDLAMMTTHPVDRRVRCLKPTARGKHIRDQVFLAAARRLEQGVPGAARKRRFLESARLFKQGNRTLRDSFPVSFFDKDREEEEPWEKVIAKRNAPEFARGRSKGSKA